MRKHFHGEWTTQDNPIERTRDREATMTSRYFSTCGAAIAAGMLISMACHDRAAADDCPAQQPMSFPLAAKGSNTNVDLKYPKQRIALKNTNVCPEKCSFGDFYTDSANPPRNVTVKASGRVKATEFRDGYTVDATINTGLFRTCYKTQAEQKTGTEGR